MRFDTQTIKGALIAALACSISFCGKEADKFKNTSTDSDSDSGADTTSDSDPVSTDPCETFHAYADGCGITGQSLAYLDLMCTLMDGLFIDSFLTEMLDCLSQESCDDFITMLALGVDTEGSDDAGLDTETNAPPDMFSSCVADALGTAEPEQANRDFQEHFCAYTTQCNADVSATECALYFTDPDQMLIFNVLDAPYITDADACVYPLPPCSNEVTTCIEDVVTQVGDTLSLLGGK